MVRLRSCALAGVLTLVLCVKSIVAQSPEATPASPPIPLDRAVGIALKGLTADSLLIDDEYQLGARQEGDIWVLTFVFWDGERAVVARVDKDGALQIVPSGTAAYSRTPPRTQLVPLKDAVAIAQEKLRREDLMYRERFRLQASEELDGSWSLLFEFLPLTPDLYVMIFVRSDGTADFGAR